MHGMDMMYIVVQSDMTKATSVLYMNHPELLHKHPVHFVSPLTM